MEHATKNQPDLSVLVRRAQAGDRSAIEALYLQTYPAIWRTVRSMTKNDEDALDVLQESYLTAFTQLGRLRRPARFLPWLKRIAVNKFRQQLRRTQPLLFTELAQDDTAPPVFQDAQEPTELALERIEEADALRRVMDKLPDGQRAILILHYCEQYSIREIADQLGVSQGTVKTQLHHGRKKLEAALRDEGLGIDDSDASLRARRSRTDTGSLFSAPLPLLLTKWKAAQALPPQETAAAALLERVPESAVTLTVKSARAMLPGRLAIGAAALAALGGLAFGARCLARAAQSYGEMQPPAEIEQVRTLPSEAERIDAPMPKETDAPIPTDLQPVTMPAEFPGEPETESSELPATPPTAPPTEAPPAPPAATDAPQAAAVSLTGLSDAQPSPTEETEAEPASAGDLTEASPVVIQPESVYPFQYQEKTLPVGQVWMGSFASDQEWEVSVLADTASQAQAVCSGSWASGRQLVTIDLNEPGVFTVFLRRGADALWVCWVRITAVSAD